MHYALVSTNLYSVFPLCYLVLVYMAIAQVEFFSFHKMAMGSKGVPKFISVPALSAPFSISNMESNTESNMSCQMDFCQSLVALRWYL